MYQLASFKYETILANNTTTVLKLRDIVLSINTGLNPRKNFKLGIGNNYYVTIKNFDFGSLNLDERCDKIDDVALSKINKRSKLAKGDILFSSIGRIGSTYLIEDTPKNWGISESVFSIRNKNPISSELLYMILSSESVSYFCNANASGSAQQGIRISSLLNCPVKIPKGQILAELNLFLKTIFDCIANIDHKLSFLRDQKQFLLSKYF